MVTPTPVIVLILAIIITWLSFHWSSSSSSWLPSSLLQLLGISSYRVVAVERLSWSSSQAFASDIVTRSFPIVLTNTHVAKWKAGRWTPDYLRRQSSTLRDISPLLDVKSSRDRHFRFTNMARHYMNSETLRHFVPPFNNTNMTLPHFIDILQRPNKHHTTTSSSGNKHNSDISNDHHDDSGEYVYFSDGIGVLGARGLDLLPHANMLSPSGDIEHCDTNIWMGQPNVVTMPHYDTSYNLFVQLYGRKRFLLAPPSSFAHVGLYPSLHAYYRQTASDIFDDSDEVLSLSRITNISQTSSLLSSLPSQRVPVIYEVILHPGDVLFVPPFWLHRVTSLELSISVNAWCPCKEFGIINSVDDVALPFDESWNDITLRTGVRRFITLVLNTLAMKILEASRTSLHPQSFMKQLINTRYIMTHVVNDTSLICPSHDDGISWRSLCGPLSSSMVHGAQPHQPAHYDTRLPLQHDTDIDRIMSNPSLILRYQERAFDIATHFSGHHPPAGAAPLFMDHDVRIISVSNWIETLVAWTVGHEPIDVARFIHCCWRI